MYKRQSYPKTLERIWKSTEIQQKGLFYNFEDKSEEVSWIVSQPVFPYNDPFINNLLIYFLLWGL